MAEPRNAPQTSPPMRSKTLAKSEKTVSASKESLQSENANRRTKIVASPTRVTTSRRAIESKNSASAKVEPHPIKSDSQSSAKSKNSLAIATQPVGSDGKSNVESKNSIGAEGESTQQTQSDGASNAESNNSIEAKVEAPQPVQSDGKSNTESNKSIAMRTESPQPAQLDDEAVKKAKIMVAAKTEDPAAVEFVDIKRAMGDRIICGHIKETRNSVEERPFLYFVQEDEAYLGEQDPESMPAMMYRDCESSR